MNINVFSRSNNTSTIPLAAEVFDVAYNQNLLHEVITSYRVNGRAGTKAQLSRSEVSGGGAKPWRQKGTGRARAGTSRSPIWRTGGVTFAAKNRDYNCKINKKVYKHALKVLFSELCRQDRLIVIDSIDISHKTKDALELMQALKQNDVLFITKEFNKDLSLAVRNLVGASCITYQEINPLVLLQRKHVCVTMEAFTMIQEWLS